VRTSTSKFRSGLVCLAVAAACHSAPPPAGPAPVMPLGDPIGLRGIVQDLEAYGRLPGTTVELALVGNTNNPVAITVTDEQGNFAFAGVPAGTYVLHIGRQGYTETRIRVEVKSADDKPLDVRLRAVRTQCVASRYHMPGCP
jgi:hypothetical protein